MIYYALDLYPSTDPLGARIARLTYTGPSGALQLAEYKGEANGTSKGQFAIRASSAIADDIDPDGLQYVRVVRIDDSILDGATLSGFDEFVAGGFFTESGKYVILSETSTKLLTWGGTGPLNVFQRAVMDFDSWIDDPFIGTDPQPDGTWPLHLAGTGNELGAIWWRVLHELEEPGRHQNPLPFMSLGFTHLLDSNGAPWVRTTGDFVAQVSDSVLDIGLRLMRMGLYIEVDPDTFEVRAYEPETHRRDRTGGAWGASVVRFQAPTGGDLSTGNIKSDATRALEAKVRRNALLVGSADTWEWVTDPGVTVPWEGGYVVDDDTGSALLKIGEAQLAARSDAGDTLRLRMKLGDDPANGRYKPFESDGVLLDDLVTVHTGTGQWDYNEAEFPVAALTLSLRPGGDWDAWADLGSTFLSSTQKAFQAQLVGAHTHPPNPRLCAATTVGGAASCSMDVTTLTQIPTPNGDWEMGDGTNWLTGSPSAGDPEGVGGSWYFIDTGVGSGGLSYNGVAGQTFVGGLTVVAYVFLDPSSTGGITIIFGSNLDIPGRTVVAASPGLNCVSWTPSGDITGVQVSLARAGSGTLAFDNVRIYSGGTGSNPLHGTSGFAARCDHVHHVLSESDPTVNDDADAGYPITTLWTNTASGDSFISTDDSAGAAVWDVFGGGTDLSGINFLVGTASGDLSAEIVVGTTPGGELGNTWASPTVDATHSGSTHSAATDTHIADATDAHDASAISILDTAGDFTATDVEGALAELYGDISAGGIPATIFDAAGDIIVASAADTAARLAAGSEDDVLTIVSGVPAWTPNVGGGVASPEWWHSDNAPGSPNAANREFTSALADTRVVHGTPKGTWAVASDGAEWTHTVSGVTELDVWAIARTCSIGDYVTLAARYPSYAVIATGIYVGFADGTTFGTNNAVGVDAHLTGAIYRHQMNSFPGFNTRGTDGTGVDLGAASMVFGWRVKYEAANTWGLYIRAPGTSAWRKIQSNYAYTMTPTHVIFGVCMFGSPAYSVDNGSGVRLESFRVND